MNKSKRFYGILLEQSAINAGTVNYFHDQADSLSMNQRMQLLLNHHESLNGKTTIYDHSIAMSYHSDWRTNLDHVLCLNIRGE